MAKSKKTVRVLKTKETDLIKKVGKRDGSVVSFNIEKIANAVYKAMIASNEGSDLEASMVANKVFADLLKISKRHKNFVPTVEGIQDSVEKELMLSDYVDTAKNYIIYRQKRSESRQQSEITSKVRQVFEESSKYFKTPYNEFIFYQFYSRWNNDTGRRETWVEAIDRFMDYMKEVVGKKFSEKEYSELREGILKQEVCPSMRLLWSAGKACRSSNVTAYNCAYIAPTTWRDLSEIMYVSMCGAGCGFSVEPENVEKFPQIQKQTKSKKVSAVVVEDSKEGWCDAFVEACEIWSSGKDADIDYSKIRPAGKKLETMGGRASGPAPLEELMTFTRRKMLGRQGRRLTTIDLHDIICQIGLIVVAGGVRRSALISLSSLDDIEMRDAKKGAFWQTNGQRSMANNSVVYETKPSAGEFMEEWTALVTSGSGERGIFNRGGLEVQLPKRRWDVLKNVKQTGMNPCGEIYLQSKQFCNLTSIVVRPDDNLASLKRKVKMATILGTYQSTLTKFKYISKSWKQNCDHERLLGVSFTGYYDNEFIRNDKVLSELREVAVKTNKEYAKKLGINQSKAVTCVKPHGNSGQMLGVGSGMHPWFSEYFIRRVRIGVTDPLLQLVKDQGVPVKPEIGYSSSNTTVMVLEFPVKAPEGAVLKDDVSAIDMLTEWKRIKTKFTEHNPSATIYVGDDEWIKVANFVYENWDIVGGLSFLPRNDHVYQLAPYEEITKKEYEERMKKIGHLDFAKLLYYEASDNTKGAKELACGGGTCEA